MQINFDGLIKDLDGNPVMSEGGTPTTLKAPACGALTASFRDEPELSAEDKLKRYRLALKASEGGTQDWAVEDVAELKRMIGKAYPPLIVGRCFDLIEPPK